MLSPHLNLVLALQLAFCYRFAVADGNADFQNLTLLSRSAATQIAAAANLYQPPNQTVSTAALVDAIVGAVATSKSGADGNSDAFINGAPLPMDDAYLSFVTTVPTLSSSLTSLGKTWHADDNAPVYTAVGALASGLHDYAAALRHSGIISVTAVVETLHAIGGLADAQACWSRQGNWPGS